MTKSERELDEYGKRLLEPLRATPPVDPEIAAQIKKNYLLKSENLRNEMMRRSNLPKSRQALRMPNIFGIGKQLAWAKVVAGALLALFVLIGSSITVYAAQYSLPGDPLYPIKSLGEDIRIFVASSPQAKLELTLDYTDRRIGEIGMLLAGGKDLPDRASERIHGELEEALWLAAQLDDGQMQNALARINQLAKSQGTTIEELINKLPEQAEPAIIRLQERLQEQVDLSDKGKDNPQAFRDEIRERHRRYIESRKLNSGNNDLRKTPGKPGGGKENNNGQPSNVPGHDDNEPGQGKSTPGNDNHNPEKTKTP